jgi:formyltetrahydrofolate deformylase
MPDHQYILTLSCPDRPGIVSALSTFLAHNGQNILDAQQFNDVETRKFFARVVFTAADLAVELSALQTGFAAIAERFQMDWQMRDRAHKKRMMLLVSKIRSLPGRHPLSLADRRARDGPDRDRLQPSARDLCRPRFRRQPVPSFAGRQRNQTRAGGPGLGAHRRDQNRSRGARALYADPVGRPIGKLSGRCINIHHSFLPGFKGARPYHQAHERGVKLIGATAHYVTSDLDEGPIIDQDVERISHRDTPDDLVRKGRDIERRVLARAIRYHLEDRVIPNGRKTVVFVD